MAVQDASRFDALMAKLEGGLDDATLAKVKEQHHGQHDGGGGNQESADVPIGMPPARRAS